ncbi:hypothetical protein ACK3Z8_06885 [Aeromonas caviae]
MEEWDPEHFTSFEHLCEVTLSAVREKTEAEQIYLWLRAPTPQLYHYRPEQGLLCLNADLLGSLELPMLFIERYLFTRTGLTASVLPGWDNLSSRCTP